MSIFKDTFPLFVENQLKIREAIMSQRSLRDFEFAGKILKADDNFTRSRTEGSQVKLKGGTTLNLPAGAFYHLTSIKQCVIRMYTGVQIDTTPDDIYDNTFRDPSIETEFGILGPINVLAGKDLNTKGFRNGYGDETKLSNPGEGYGIVPPPGIVDMNVRTVSAYGSLREAKINFVCHNRRQLDKLEQLYMKVGYPIMVEWGWAPYISNTGKIEKDFPIFQKFFDEKTLQGVQEEIRNTKKIRSGNWDAFIGYCKNFEYKSREDGGFDCSTHVISSGEVLSGLKGRRDGFYHTVEGKKKEQDNFEHYLGSIQEWQESLAWLKGEISSKEYTGKEDYGEKQTTSKALSLSAEHFFKSFIERNDLFGSLQRLTVKVAGSGDDVQLFTEDHAAIGFERDKKSLIMATNPPTSNAIQYDKNGKKLRVTETNRRNMAGEQTYRKMNHGSGPLVPYMGGNPPQTGDTPLGNLIDESYRLDGILDNFVIRKGEKITLQSSFESIVGEGYDADLLEEDVAQINKSKSPHSFIRWDFMCYLLNTEVFPYEENNPKNKLIEILHYNRDDKYPEYFEYARYDVMKGNGKIPKNAIYEEAFQLSEIMDISFNPGVCILPHQFYATEGKKYDVVIAEGEDCIASTSNSIGMIFLNIDHLLSVYRSMRYDNQGGLNGDFNMLAYLKQIWEKDVNGACGGSHNFTIHHDKENTSVVRVIDVNISTKLQPNDLYNFKIQSNESVVRDFNFNSTIPSALSSTVAISAQNPDSISSLEQVTAAAINKGIKSRFATIEHDQQKIFDKRKDEELQLIEKASELMKYKKAIARGDYLATKKVDNVEVSKYIGASTAINYYKRIEELVIILQSKYPLFKNTNTMMPAEIFKIDGMVRAGFRRNDFSMSKSAVIPLKFNAKIDGISGIVIGNIFKVQKNRLPKGYQGEDIAFVTFTENQTVTSGQDWTTEISGQIMLLDLPKSEEESSHVLISHELDPEWKMDPDRDMSNKRDNADRVRTVLRRFFEHNYDIWIGENEDITNPYPISQQSAAWWYEKGNDNMGAVNQISAENQPNRGELTTTKYENVYIATVKDGAGNRYSRTIDPNKGDITSYMADATIAVLFELYAQNLNGGFPSTYRLTGGNDDYHHDVLKGGGQTYVSKHCFGEAVDLTWTEENDPENNEAVNRILQAFAVHNDNFSFINETGLGILPQSTPNSTGHHWHLVVSEDGTFGPAATQAKKRAKEDWENGTIQKWMESMGAPNGKFGHGYGVWRSRGIQYNGKQYSGDEAGYKEYNSDRTWKIEDYDRRVGNEFWPYAYTEGYEPNVPIPGGGPIPTDPSDI